MKRWLRSTLEVSALLAGVALAIAPWRPLWNLNGWVADFVIGAIWLHPITRGAVSGIGLAMVLHGGHELLERVVGENGVKA